MEASAKRVKVDVDSMKFHIYIIPQKIQRRRLDILVSKSREKGLPITDTFCANVTHVISELETVQQTIRALCCEPDDWKEDTLVVKSAWLFECITAGRLVNVQPKHCVPLGCTISETQAVNTVAESVPEYACQRVTLLQHHNKKFTDALGILEEFAHFIDDEISYARALAFRRAAATLSSLSHSVTTKQDVNNLPSVGEHSKKVIKDIMDTGFSSEAEAAKSDNWFQQMKTFTGVYGVGPATAKKWIKSGILCIDDALQSADVLAKHDVRILAGLTHYNDLSTPVSRSEADKLARIILAEVMKLVPGTTVELVGGFRRGKDFGHDIDLLISHPEEGKEKGVLEQLMSVLESRGVVLQGRREHSTFSLEDCVGDVMMVSRPSGLKNALDHFEKWIGIMKVDSSLGEDKNCSLTHKDDGNDVLSRSWRARRVDLIIAPTSQYYYALVGWTGSKHFNRSLRLYAQRRFGLRLTSHCLYDPASKHCLPASSEEDVFSHLELVYRQPHERNC